MSTCFTAAKGPCACSVEQRGRQGFGNKTVECMVLLKVSYLLVESPLGNRPALPSFEVQVLLLQGLMLSQLLLFFLQLHAMFEYHLGRLVERRRRENTLTTHVPNCRILQSTYFLLQQEKTGMPPDPSMTDNVNCKTVLCMLMDITLMGLSPVLQIINSLVTLWHSLGELTSAERDPPAWSSSCRQQSWRVNLTSRCYSLTLSVHRPGHTDPREKPQDTSECHAKESSMLH
ncbi:hypothetical protein XENOCAPTIV_015244 [Xenoophorus captivus]|uniref:Uncharacterized protein n=1 Tax=Xenoophorus captivus TaxID=1517983 RepID=A0ABV0RYV4_9TELE